MDEFQKNVDFIVGKHSLEKKPVRTGLFSRRTEHRVITATDAGDLAQLKKALAAVYFTAEEYTVRGKDVIFLDRGEDKILRQQHRHALENNPHWLDYDALTSPEVNVMFHPRDGNVQVCAIQVYTAIDYRGRDSALTPRPEEKYIAKFHLSVHRDDIRKAWNAIADYLVDNEILCKVITPRALETAASVGLKPIVLYVTRKKIQDTDRWQKALTDIESILVANDVRAGSGYDSDRPVEGSRYFHLRYGDTVYDRNTGATSRWNDDLQVLNGGVDSFADLKISVTEDEAKRFQAQVASRPRGTRERHG